MRRSGFFIPRKSSMHSNSRRKKRKGEGKLIQKTIAIWQIRPGATFHLEEGIKKARNQDDFIKGGGGGVKLSDFPSN